MFNPKRIIGSAAHRRPGRHIQRRAPVSRRIDRPLGDQVRELIRLNLPNHWSLLDLAEDVSSSPNRVLYRVVKDGQPLSACLLLDVTPGGELRCFLTPLMGREIPPGTPLVNFGFRPIPLQAFDGNAARRLLSGCFAALQRHEYWAMLG